MNNHDNLYTQKFFFFCCCCCFKETKVKVFKSKVRCYGVVNMCICVGMDECVICGRRSLYCFFSTVFTKQKKRPQSLYLCSLTAVWISLHFCWKVFQIYSSYSSLFYSYRLFLNRCCFLPAVMCMSVWTHCAMCSMCTYVYMYNIYKWGSVLYIWILIIYFCLLLVKIENVFVI